MRVLERPEEQLAGLHLQMLASIIHGLTAQELGVNFEKFAREVVSIGVGEKQTVAFILDRVAAGDDVDHQTALRHPVESRRHARRHCRRLQPRPHRDEKAQALGLRRKRRGDDPGIFAAFPGGQERTVIAKRVGGLGDLPEIGEIDGAAAQARSEVTSISVGWDEPENVDGFARAHEAAFLTTSDTLIGLGISPSERNASAMRCWSATTWALSGVTPKVCRFSATLRTSEGIPTARES